MKRFFFVLLASICIVSAPAAYAQTSLGNAIDPVRFNFSPEVPGPQQRVTIEAQGVGTFLGDATITWRLNGAVSSSGVGERTFSFTTGGIGEQSKIEVTIVSSSKGTITKSFVFIPSAVNLVWEADTSVPPFFTGKALYSAGSRLTVTAFPTIVANGKTISSNNFSFQWSRNGSKVADRSGMGRNTYSFTGDQLLSKENITVDVYFGDVLAGRGFVSIPAVPPAVVLYHRDPLLGVRYDTAVPSSFNLTATEATFQAQPFFFSNTSIANNDIQFEWRINNKEATGPNAAQGVITLRQTGTTAGESSLRVKVQNLDTKAFIQAAERVTRILIGSQNNSLLPSIFGL